MESVEMKNWNLIKQNYEGKKVFVTGHTGFKGGWLTKILSLAGAEVMGYSLPTSTTPNIFGALQIEQNCISILADILDKEKLKTSILSFQPDYIFHLAAQPLVRLSYRVPSETFAVNSIGTAYVLDALTELEKTCTAVFITTDKVYHNNEWDYPYRECDRLGGYDPYSASKACAELVIDSYRNSFFNEQKYDSHKKRIFVARAGNVIGGGDWSEDRLVPDIIRAITTDKNVILRNAQSVRPWQHVLEPLSGYLLLGATGLDANINHAFNFGPNTEDTLTVEELVKLAIKFLGRGGYETIQNTEDFHEAKLLKLDVSLAKSQLNWQPILSAAQAVDWTMSWYQKFYASPADINEYTNTQVFSFFDI